MWLCATSFGRAVVPEVKYSSMSSSAPVSALVKSSGAACDALNCVQPGTAGPTAMRTGAPGSVLKRGANCASVSTALTCPRSRRSARSSRSSSVLAGIITAPSRISASMLSHNATQFGSMTRTRSPRVTPSAAMNEATCRERCATAANDAV